MGPLGGPHSRNEDKKRREDREREREEEQSGLGEGLYQTFRTVSGTTGHGQFEERDREVERLRRLVRDLELDARNRPQRRDQDDRERRDDNVGDCNGGESSQSGSCQRRTVPENHANEGLDPTLEDHVDAGTVPILGNHIDEETIHVRMGMLTEVRTLPRSNSPTMLLWMP